MPACGYSGDRADALVGLPDRRPDLLLRLSGRRYSGLAGFQGAGPLRCSPHRQADRGDPLVRGGPGTCLPGGAIRERQLALSTLTLSGPGQELQGNAAIGLFGHYYLSDLTGRVKAEVLPKLLDQTFIRPAGDLDIDLALLELSNGRILRAKGKVQWLKARIRTPIPANLDGLEFDLDGQDSTLVIGIHDLKGPIGILGDLTLEPDGKFHLKGRVKPTQAADPSLANSLRSLGRVNADGSITIDYQGQL